MFCIAFPMALKEKASCNFRCGLQSTILKKSRSARKHLCRGTLFILCRPAKSLHNVNSVWDLNYKRINGSFQPTGNVFGRCTWQPGCLYLMITVRGLDIIHGRLLTVLSQKDVRKRDNREIR